MLTDDESEVVTITLVAVRTVLDVVVSVLVVTSSLVVVVTFVVFVTTGFTIMTICSVFDSSSIAVITALPGPTAVMIPPADTTATSVLLERYRTSCLFAITVKRSPFVRIRLSVFSFSGGSCEAVTVGTVVVTTVGVAVTNVVNVVTFVEVVVVIDVVVFVDVVVVVNVVVVAVVVVTYGETSSIGSNLIMLFFAYFSATDPTVPRNTKLSSHPENAFLPILVTVSGISRYFRFTQSEKALSPICVIPSCKIICLISDV